MAQWAIPMTGALWLTNPCYPSPDHSPHVFPGVSFPQHRLNIGTDGIQSSVRSNTSPASHHQGGTWSLGTSTHTTTPGKQGSYQT